MKKLSTIPTLAALAMLAACNTQADEDAGKETAPDPSASASLTPDPDAPVSIIRSDIEQPELFFAKRIPPVPTQPVTVQVFVVL